MVEKNCIFQEETSLLTYVLFGSIEITLLVQHHSYKYFIFEHFF